MLPFVNADQPSKPPIPEWDDYFCALAMVASMRSKDPNCRVGAVVVGAADVVLSTGFNGFPRGIRELPERWLEQDEKLQWVTHAEANAIFNAARTGLSLVDGTIYVTMFPCTTCAQAIVQAGLRRVVTYGGFWKKDPNSKKRISSTSAEVEYDDKSMQLLCEAHIIVDAPNIRQEDHARRMIEWKAPSGAPNNGKSGPTTASHPESRGRHVLMERPARRAVHKRRARGTKKRSS